MTLIAIIPQNILLNYFFILSTLYYWLRSHVEVAGSDFPEISSYGDKNKASTFLFIQPGGMSITGTGTYVWTVCDTSDSNGLFY